MGFGSSYRRYTSKDLTVILLCNHEGAELMQLAGAVAEYYLKDIRHPIDPDKDIVIKELQDGQ